MMLRPFIIILLSLVIELVASFSTNQQRVFVSTPTPENPKRLVSECMSSPLVLNPNELVDDAIAIFLSSGHSSAPVVSKNMTLIGIVSSFDFLQKEAFGGALLPLEGSTEEVEPYINAAKKICGQRVQDIMTPNPVSIPPTMSMQVAAALMTSERIHRLPVVDKAGKLVGLITTSDVMKDLLYLVRDLPPVKTENNSAP